MQFVLVEELGRNHQHPRIQPEPDCHLEVSAHGAGCVVDWPYIPCSLSRHEPRRTNCCHRCRWWNSQILEDIQQASRARTRTGRQQISRMGYDPVTIFHQIIVWLVLVLRRPWLPLMVLHYTRRFFGFIGVDLNPQVSFFTNHGSRDFQLFSRQVGVFSLKCSLGIYCILICGFTAFTGDYQALYFWFLFGWLSHVPLHGFAFVCFYHFSLHFKSQTQWSLRCIFIPQPHTRPCG